MWTICAEAVDSPQAVGPLREYFAELTVRYFHRETTEQEIDKTLDEFPTTGLALFLVLAPAGHPPAASAFTRPASSPGSTSPRSFAG